MNIKEMFTQFTVNVNNVHFWENPLQIKNKLLTLDKRVKLLSINVNLRTIRCYQELIENINKNNTTYIKPLKIPSK